MARAVDDYPLRICPVSPDSEAVKHSLLAGRIQFVYHSAADSNKDATGIATVLGSAVEVALRVPHQGRAGSRTICSTRKTVEHFLLTFAIHLDDRPEAVYTSGIRRRIESAICFDQVRLSRSSPIGSAGECVQHTKGLRLRWHRTFRQPQHHYQSQRAHKRSL